MSKMCDGCECEFIPRRSDQQFCKVSCRKLAYSQRYLKTCEFCYREFRCGEPLQRFCSLTCFGRSDDGGRGGRKRSAKGAAGPHPDHPSVLKEAFSLWGEPYSWSIDRGYVYYYWPGHPVASSGNRIHEHRAIAYQLWGDEIRGRHVDHIDGDKTNNDPSNLQVLTMPAHNRKTANSESPTAFWLWVKESHPEWIDEWREDAAP